MKLHSLPSPSGLNPKWGVRFAGHKSDETKGFVASWISAMGKNPGLASRMRNDSLTEADLFETKRQCRNLIAVQFHKIEFYPTSG